MIGVVGAAPQVDLYAIKALDRRGSGYLSDIIEGLDWAVANGMKVVNMSLGSDTGNQSFHDVVTRVNQAGVAIFSTYKGSTYKTLPGTSMALPHVAGSAALVLTQAPATYDANSNGVWDPAEVLNKLKATATDLGSNSTDPLYGAGLVDAALAVQP